MFESAEVSSFFVLFFLGYFFGSYLEKKHYRSIGEREEKFIDLPAVSIRKAFAEDQVAEARLVVGSVVISIDYFKRIVAALRNIFGGGIRSYETLVDRARREAILRMKEQVPGAQLIVNVRIETSSIGQNANQRRNAIGSVEAVAYGTAVWLKS